MEEERQGPEGHSEVRAKAQASRNSRKLESSPGAWSEGLVLDREVSQGTPPERLRHTDSSQSVRKPPHLSIWDSVFVSLDPMQETRGFAWKEKVKIEKREIENTTQRLEKIEMLEVSEQGEPTVRCFIIVVNR